MLKINNTEYKILLSEIKYINTIYNNLNGYSILVSIDIKLNDTNGYISFYVDFFDTKDFKNIENKKYIEIPNKLDSKISMIEIYDTKNFFDSINGKVILNFGNIKNNQIEINLHLNDELINLEYQGILDIK